MHVEKELDDLFNGLYRILFCSEGGVFSPVMFYYMHTCT